MPGIPIESDGRSGWVSSRAYRVAHFQEDMAMGAETRGRMEEMLLAEASRSCCAATAMVKGRRRRLGIVRARGRFGRGKLPVSQGLTLARIDVRPRLGIEACYTQG